MNETESRTKEKTRNTLLEICVFHNILCKSSRLRTQVQQHAPIAAANSCNSQESGYERGIEVRPVSSRHSGTYVAS
jgi:hypothetical protein